MSQTVYIWGLPVKGIPYVSGRVEQPAQVGDIVNFDGIEYEIYQADPITRENQLQNAYVRLKENNDLAKQVEEDLRWRTSANLPEPPGEATSHGDSRSSHNG